MSPTIEVLEFEVVGWIVVKVQTEVWAIRVNDEGKKQTNSADVSARLQKRNLVAGPTLG